MNAHWPYFDSMSSTPLDHRVWLAMEPYLLHNFANPSAQLYPQAWDARRAIEKAQSQLQAVEPNMHWNFHSGATEGILSIILGFARGAQNPLILTSPYEHEAVLSACQTAGEFFPNLQCETLIYHQDGQPDYEQLNARIALHKGDILLSLIHVQNEIGLILNVSLLIDSLIERDRIYLHLDSSQSLGKHLNDRNLTGVDFVNFSAHKVYGPKGIGALGVSSRGESVYKPILIGGHQQQGRRGGTIPSALVVGFAHALAIAEAEKTDWLKQATSWHQTLYRFLKDEFPNVIFSSASEKLINCHTPFQADLTYSSQNQNEKAWAVPHLLNFCLPSFTASEIQKALWGIAYSTGSACSSSEVGLSRALEWRGLSMAEALSTLRIAFHRGTTDSDLETLKSKLLSLKS